MFVLIEKNKCHLTGSCVSFFMFIFGHGAKMEGVSEYAMLVISGLMVSVFGWVYPLAMVLLSLIN